MSDVKDITIIGAGPTGLFAAFYAGMRGASHRLIDNLDQVGGQLTALYPEKYVFDVAGFPKVLAKDLVKGMAEQGLQWKAPVHLGQKVIGLRQEQESGENSHESSEPATAFRPRHGWNPLSDECEGMRFFHGFGRRNDLAPCAPRVSVELYADNCPTADWACHP